MSDVRAPQALENYDVHRRTASVRHDSTDDAGWPHDRLTTSGKRAKIAITAVMRKLVIIANALLRDDRLRPPKAA